MKLKSTVADNLTSDQVYDKILRISSFLLKLPEFDLQRTKK